MDIHNYTITFKLNTIITNAYNKISKYNPFVFSGLVMKFNAPKVTFIIHKTGNVIMLGKFKNDRRVKYAVKKLENKIRKIYKDAEATDIVLKNVVVGGKKISHKLKPECLKDIFGKYFFYEPELFPGMRIFDEHSNACLTIFQNGKWYITGVTTIKYAEYFIARFETMFSSQNKIDECALN
ncbi:TATA-box-binding protein-like isoform X2 [Leptotrombidium deliense]|uniref:TATA-box-binding protein-like isoform X2 n=1 Tax=Leptotrombidium deliense TaxID=299467 RepID=A0A443SIV1_9ACAR|nr:TATA-box-binding protein-like isoform X2 [Leptotrombidium deliense]